MVNSIINQDTINESQNMHNGYVGRAFTIQNQGTHRFWVGNMLVAPGGTYELAHNQDNMVKLPTITFDKFPCPEFSGLSQLPMYIKQTGSLAAVQYITDIHI
jgi:hypothetical protein